MTSNRRGATLLEVLVVLGVLGLAAASVLPAFNGRAAERTEGVSEIVDLLEAAARSARRERACVRVHIAGADWSVIQAPSCGAMRSERRGTFRLGGGQVAEGVFSFSFRPDGTAVGDTLEFIIAAERWLIAVRPWSGRAERRVD